MKRAAGSVLLLLLLVLGVVATWLALRSSAGMQIERDRITASALGQAREALIGFATAYRYLVNDEEVFGYLPCPDSNNDGVAHPPCGASQVSVLGRLPWKTRSMALAPLRDSAAECLWYAVSGALKDSPKASPLNWDTLGQFTLQDAAGTALTGPTPHDRAWAVVLAPLAALPGQPRLGAGTNTECGGNLVAANYLEGSTLLAGAGAVSTLVLGNADSRQGALNNDQGRWITAQDVFDRLKKRSDFKADIDQLLGDLQLCLNKLPPGHLGLTPSVGNKGVDQVVAACAPAAPLKGNILKHWQNNLLYARPALAPTLNGLGGCSAVLFFAGERTQRSVAPLGAQLRDTPARIGSATQFGDPAMYLEGVNAIFPAAGAYAGAGFFDPVQASADLLRCVKGLAPGQVQQSFDKDLASFNPVGAGVTIDSSSGSVGLAAAAGSVGGCIWSPTAVPLAGKTLRAYDEFRFAFADAFALTGAGVDRGNGFTLQLVGADVGAAPGHCGSKAMMGALDAADPWGQHSIIIETDVHRDPAPSLDPVQNHSAILLHGHLDHAQAGDSMSLACDGRAVACRHGPANRFEESPPATHRQRVEIHSGCNADCGRCNPAAHAAPNDFLRVAVWVDCSDCSDVAVDLDRLVQTPSMQRCVAPDAALASVYYGVTGGFLSGSRRQGVALSQFVLRAD